MGKALSVMEEGNESGDLWDDISLLFWDELGELGLVGGCAVVRKVGE